MQNKLTKALLTAGLAFGVASATTAADAPALQMGASASMLANTCAGCHGTDGVSQGPAAPTISGFSKDYFVETMKGFAEGTIDSTVMGRMAQGYTDEEIGLIADFYVAKPYVKAKQSFDEAQVDTGAKLHDKYCEKCHADGGTSRDDDSGLLAGQWTPYLNWTLQDYQAGNREITKKMKKKLSKLVEKEGDAGIAALLSYYASQQ